MVKKRKFTKIAFAFSICLFILWGVLGTGTSIAWFMDDTPGLKNTFEFGELDVEIYHKVQNIQGNNEWVKADENTKLFNEKALYEPGYTEVVYLKIVNAGDVAFDYKLSVDMNDYVPGINESGQPIYLPNYLKFGVLLAEDEETLERECARAIATTYIQEGNAVSKEMLPLNTYSSNMGQLEAKPKTPCVQYAALIIYMPEEIGNEANYRGDAIPGIELGITVLATQKR